jgi:hypothetical protein
MRHITRRVAKKHTASSLLVKLSPDYIAGAASDRDRDRDENRPARSRCSRRQPSAQKRKRARKKRDPRTPAGLGGAGGGGEDPRPDEVGEEAGEDEQERVVHRDEQRRGPVAPALGRLLPRSGAELIGFVHLALLPLPSPVPATPCAAGWEKRPARVDDDPRDLPRAPCTTKYARRNKNKQRLPMGAFGLAQNKNLLSEKKKMKIV